jgi:mannan endo-1,6-alpha-mannosidase
LRRTIEATDVFFSQEGAPNIMLEVACERNGLCDHDQRSFKAYLSRWMGWTVLAAPWTKDSIMPRLRASAVAAAKQCGGGAKGNTCGLRWWRNGENDGEVGVGEQMSALEVIQNLLVDQVAGPVSEETGGISKNDPSAGTDTQAIQLEFDHVTTGDRAGAGILTTVVLAGLFGGSWWLVQGE